MEQLAVGILAHVDAGKTTLSEAMLYLAGSIRRVGRVDNQDAYLDTHRLERARGITIFSKQAVLNLGERTVSLLDTPGHVDFSAEMERTLQVLDYAILVISGADGVQGHTRTLWQLLARYEIPVFLFVNKMDQPGTKRQTRLDEIRALLSDGCVDFTETDSEAFYESIAVCDETVLEQYLQEQTISKEQISRLIAERKVFPCWFGSALKMQGVEEFMQGFSTYSMQPVYPQEFGARVFKISRDEKGNRLTHLKITGGSLKVRDVVKQRVRNLTGNIDEEAVQTGTVNDKVTQIRIYSGDKFETASEVQAGCVCAVMGLTAAQAGDGLGFETEERLPLLEPVLFYAIQLPDDTDPQQALGKLRQLEEEEPQLHIVWDEQLQQIGAQIMGEVQLEVLRSVVEERFQLPIRFEEGKIVYKETIKNVVEGVGHFEPLRHYAEVHLLMEPGEPGSGLVFDSACSEDVLTRNWQRLVLTHLEERVHKGVLIGAPITDMRITLAAGRAHLKHTEGGDFRQATYRAVRQGLMQAESVLLEPVYEFRMELPESMVGRAMTDVERMCGTCTVQTADWMLENPQGQSANPASAFSNGGERMAVLTGTAPVATMNHYQQELTAYTRGFGRLTCNLCGYAPCHNTEEVVLQQGYDPETDLRNPTGSVFCAHGAGFVVPWNQVRDYMQVESIFEKKKDPDIVLPRTEPLAAKDGRGSVMDTWIGVEEVDAILANTYGSNRRKSKTPARRWKYAKRVEAPVGVAGKTPKKTVQREQYLLVDGYNIIFAWEDLRELAYANIDGARGALLDLLCDYQGIRGYEVIVVFDAYRVQGHQTEAMDYHNIHVVYTKEAETADQYIERFAVEHAKEYGVTVATSDGLEQVIIRSQNCRLFSAGDLRLEIDRAKAQLREDYQLE